MTEAKVRVWDLPVRIFHWSLVLLMTGVFVTAKIGGNAMAWHGRFGLAILGLLVFRIVWGFVGSAYARFSYFVRGPAAIVAYLRGEWSGIGHNPLGALSVLALLVLPLVQTLTGLFANDDIAFQGYLYSLVDAGMSSRITGLHKLGEPVLILIVALHLAAIIFYVRVKKQNLVTPMITGCMDGVSTEGAQLFEVGKAKVWPFVFAVALAILAIWGASGIWINVPEPVPAAETPAW